MARGIRTFRTADRLGELSMITRRDAALRLDIPMEMATRHGLPSRMTEREFAELDANPPAWLAQSRANRTGKPVWVTLTCAVCGFTEQARPKKWWPTFTYLTCDFHRADEIPLPASGLYRREVESVGTRFIGVIDEKP
jgi:hypothetical protein